MNEQKRETIKKLAYVAPVILTLAVTPSFAGTGSGKTERSGKTSDPYAPEKGNNGLGNGRDPAPPGSPKLNDGPRTSPGHPGNKTNCGTCHTG